MFCRDCLCLKVSQFDLVASWPHPGFLRLHPGGRCLWCVEFLVQGFRRPENLDCLWVWCPSRVLANTSMTSRMVGRIGTDVVVGIFLFGTKKIGHLRGKDTICQVGWHSWVISAFWRECNWTHPEIVVDCFKMAWHGVTLQICAHTKTPTAFRHIYILCTYLYFICYRLYVDMLYVDNMCIFFWYPTSWHLRMSVSLSSRPWIVRSSWSQMKRPRWSLITGAAWC